MSIDSTQKNTWRPQPITIEEVDDVQNDNDEKYFTPKRLPSK